MSEQRHSPKKLITEAASLLHLLGGMTPKHLVIVGGLVPPLLVPESPDPHAGSADIDLALSVAITEGGTSEYYQSIEKIIDPYFEPFESGFRWAANVGTRLRPFPLSAGRIVDEDAIATTVENVELVYKDDTYADVEMRHAGPVGFLASKADALDSRDDPKDGYDISWWCINAGSTPDEVAKTVIGRPAFKDLYFQDSVAKLQKAFRKPNFVGPTGYAHERDTTLGPGDPAFEEDRNRAFAVVSRVIDLLRSNLFT